MSLQPGDVIDTKYRIVRLLGEGGMGAVYEGENARIHRRVAIKVLHPEMASNTEAVRRFEREAQAAGRIGSEHIAEVLDLGALPSGSHYMVMEYLDGESLRDRILSARKMHPKEIVPIVAQMLEALQAAHDAGIVHRDLKPDNVFLVRRQDRTDFVKLLDFGISKFSAMSTEFSMTRTGAIMGTPYYMPPEQARGARNIDHRADLYAVGVIVYEATSGKVPFDAKTFNELIFKIVRDDAQPLSSHVPGLDPTFAALVNRAMARDPNDRFQSAREFQQALENWLADPAAALDRTSLAGTPEAFGATVVQASPPTKPSPAGPSPAGPSPASPTPVGAGYGNDRPSQPVRESSAGEAPARESNPQTLDPWAASQGPATAFAVPLKRAPLLGVAAAAVVLALGLGAYFFVAGGEGAQPPEDDPALDAASAPKAEAQTNPTKPAEAKEPPAEPRSEGPTEPTKALDTTGNTTADDSEATPNPAPKASPTPRAATPPATTKAAATASPRSSPPKAPSPPATATPAPSPKTIQKSSATNRPIRMDL